MSRVRQRDLMIKITTLSEELHKLKLLQPINYKRRMHAVVHLITTYRKQLMNLTTEMYGNPEEEDWMTTRIRYKNTGGTEYAATKGIETNNGLVGITFDLSNFEVDICRWGDNTVIESFIAKNEHAMKKEIKNRLIAMGAVFGSESRNRNKNLPVPINDINSVEAVSQLEG